MSPVALIILFLIGIAFGSFLNVVSLRYKPSKSVFHLSNLKGRSRCPFCKESLRWYELIPLVSYLIQLGRCRRCGEKLTVQYPLVELLSGLIVAGVPLYLFNFYRVANIPLNHKLFYGLAGFWVLVFLVWLLISVIDQKHYLIPDELNALLLAFGFFIVVLKDSISEMVLPFHNSFLKQFLLILSPSQDIWFNHILGAVVAALFFYLLMVVSRGKAMGGGDLKLAFASGFVVGWPEIALGIVIAFIAGGIWGAVLILRNKKSMADKLPFAPFLISGMAVSIFLGSTLVQWYLGLFGI